MSIPAPLVCQVIPPRTAVRDLPALETAMQALALDARHPIALEIAGSATARLFLIRATSRPALEHLAAQLYARYPQATLLPLTARQDPLHLCEHEAISALELNSGAASYLPLRSWRERELTQEGTDPVLGLLAALGQLPPNMRVIAQLALVPAPHTWSQSSQRLAVEHPLEHERLRERYRSGVGNTSGPLDATPAPHHPSVGLASWTTGAAWQDDAPDPCPGKPACRMARRSPALGSPAFHPDRSASSALPAHTYL